MLKITSSICGLSGMCCFVFQTSLLEVFQSLHWLKFDKDIFFTLSQALILLSGIPQASAENRSSFLELLSLCYHQESPGCLVPDLLCNLERPLTGSWLLTSWKVPSFLFLLGPITQCHEPLSTFLLREISHEAHYPLTSKEPISVIFFNLKVSIAYLYF